MRRMGAFLRMYGFNVLIVIAAGGIALEVAIRYGAPTGSTTLNRFVVPAAALMVLPLLAGTIHSPHPLLSGC